MALEFALAVISGVVVALLSSLLSSRPHETDAVLEVVDRTAVRIRSIQFVDGEIVEETLEARIRETTFRIPVPRRRWAWWFPLMLGVLIFAGALAILLLV